MTGRDRQPVRGVARASDGIAVRARGVGRRPSAVAMAAFGDDVAAVVRHLGLGEVVLIGHSMGGDVVVETALRLGGQVLGRRLGTPTARSEIHRPRRSSRSSWGRSGRTSPPRPVPSSGGYPVQLEDPATFNRLLGEFRRAD